jgi:secreted PhoX family phosphatase
VDQAAHYESLDGIVWTPWNTLLFAEERIVASFKDPRVPNAVGGLVYEWDPVRRITRPLPAVGARSHEGLRFDAQGNLYGISETNPNATQSGAIYKFVPDRRGDLSSGQLYALKVLDGATRTGEATWMPLDRDLVQINSDLAAIQVGATGWGRPEDLEINTAAGNVAGGAQILFVASTSEDLVLRIELRGDRAWVSNFVQNGVNVSGLDNPDNLAIDNQGTLYIIEDNGPSDIWAVRHSGRPELVASEVVRFASLSDCSAESTGLYFDRNGGSAWVHVQHAGGPLSNDLLVEIRKE